MGEDESAYWFGARDLALFELNELTAMRAPFRVRQRALEIFLATAQRGSVQLAVEIGGLMRSTSKSQGRPARRASRPPTRRV